MKFILLGLGNSNCQRYNQFAKNALNVLRDLGRSPLLLWASLTVRKDWKRRTFFDWSTTLFETATQKLGMEEKTRQYSPALSIVLSTKTITTDTSMKCPADDAGLTKGRAKSTLCPIRLVDISQLLELKYNTGDHIAV